MQEMIYFTSDTHFGHSRIIDYCRRPFRNVDHMDEELIRRWNSRVKDGDSVVHLGDFSFYNSSRTKEIISRLNGEISLVRGNHDRNPGRFFTNVADKASFRIAGVTVLASHYPYRGVQIDARDFSSRQIEYHDGWLLCGHVHDRWIVNGRMINVGVDAWDFAPISEDEVAEIIVNGGWNG